MERQVEIYEAGWDEPRMIDIPLTEDVTAVTFPVVESVCVSLSKEPTDVKEAVERVLLSLATLTRATSANVSISTDGTTICLSVDGMEVSYGYSTMAVGKFFGHGHSTKIVASNDMATDPRAAESLPTGHRQIKTFLSTPLIHNEKCIGRIILANSDKYTLTDVCSVVKLIPIVSSLIHRYSTYKNSPDVNRVAEVSGAKDRFLATMSHELRTPLNGITAMVTMLPDAGPLNEKQRDYVKLLTECTFQLTNLLNNILDFSKMAANCLVLGKTPFSIYKAIDDAITITEGKAISKNLRIEKSLPNDIPNMVGDSQRITQVLSNLLSNAVKFTEKGSVKISLRTELLNDSDYTKRWKLMFDVQDTGMGIDVEEQERIFETFQQSASLSTYLSKSGTGLGLSISRELVRLMEGHLAVSSLGRGHGSTFSFFIMLDEEIQIGTLHKRHIELFKGSNILVVDDRAEIRIQLCGILRQWGCKPTVFASAEEALLDVRADMRYSVALVDIHMPYMSGIDLAKTLRSEFPTLPMIGISSVDVEGGSAYFDYYMFKPIDQNQLFPALLQCLLHPPDRAQTGDIILESKGVVRKRKFKKNLRILIAEDDSYNAYACKEMLCNIGFEAENIQTVPDGQKCVDKVKTEQFDVVLMDLVMPIMDGYEATRYIRQMKTPPFIIAISAAVQASDREKCQAVGIDCYLSKPLLRESLAEALSPLIKKSAKK